MPFDWLGAVGRFAMLLDSIDVSTVVGLRDRALIAVMISGISAFLPFSLFASLLPRVYVWMSTKGEQFS